MKDLFDNELSGAIFSEDRTKRFVLWRTWDEQLPKVMFIGLNPSTANELKNDPTITRICDISKWNGFGGVFMLNLFSCVTAYPEEIVVDKIPENNSYLLQYAKKANNIVFCWGNFKQAIDRSKEVIKMFPNSNALFLNKNKSPKHPLYCKIQTKLIPYETTF